MQEISGHTVQSVTQYRIPALFARYKFTKPVISMKRKANTGPRVKSKPKKKAKPKALTSAKIKSAFLAAQGLCTYTVKASSPAALSSMKAFLNGQAVPVKRIGPNSFAGSKAVATNGSGQLQLDVDVRGRRKAGVTIVVTNDTQKKQIDKEGGAIGEPPHTPETAYKIQNKLIQSQCVHAQVIV